MRPPTHTAPGSCPGSEFRIRLAARLRSSGPADYYHITGCGGASNSTFEPSQTALSDPNVEVVPLRGKAAGVGRVERI